MTSKSLFTVFLIASFAAAASGHGVKPPVTPFGKVMARIQRHLQAASKTHALGKKGKKLPDQIITLDWNKVKNGYADSSEKLEIFWNNDSTPRQMVDIYYSNPDEKYVIDGFQKIKNGADFNDYEFLGDYVATHAIGYIKVGKVWTYNENITVQYTSRGAEKETYMKWNGTGWVNSTQTYSLFDTQDMPLGYLNQEWQNGAWVNTEGQKADFTYDPDGNPRYAIYSVMKAAATDWSPIENGITREVYYLSPIDEIQSAVQYSTDGTNEMKDSIGDIVWQSYDQLTPGFIAAGGEAYKSYTSYLWDDAAGAWLASESYSKKYNGAGQEIEAITQMWDDAGGAWVNSDRMTQDYDADGEFAGLAGYTWDNNAWKMNYGNKVTNSYDADGDIVMQTQQSYNSNNSTWENQSMTTYHYATFSGMAEGRSIPSLRFYPNPATSELTVETAGLKNETATLKILDLQGRMARESKVASNGKNIAVPIASLKAGMYILRIESGSQVFTGRFEKR